MANGYPEGQYTNVRCIPIQRGGGYLNGGTGQYSLSAGNFACGPFDEGNLPEAARFFNLTGVCGRQQYQFPGWMCVRSREISDFGETALLVLPDSAFHHQGTTTSANH